MGSEAEISLPDQSRSITFYCFVVIFFNPVFNSFSCVRYAAKTTKFVTAMMTNTCKMATRRIPLSSFLPSSSSQSEPNRELFEACRNGDLTRVKKFVNQGNINARDTAGRKSSPLHFAAGKRMIQTYLYGSVSVCRPND